VRLRQLDPRSAHQSLGQLFAHHRGNRKNRPENTILVLARPARKPVRFHRKPEGARWIWGTQAGWRRLAAEGAVVADVRAEAAEATAETIRDAGGRARTLAWDLGTLSAIDAHVAIPVGRCGLIPST
jgi:hypothetical protein